MDVLTWTVLVPMLTADPAASAAHLAAFTSYESLVQHGLNALLVYGDLALTAGAPMEAHYLGWVSLWSGAFATWAVCYWWATGTWLYPVRGALCDVDTVPHAQFLETSHWWSPLAYVGLFVVHWLAFLAGPMTLARVLRGQSSTVFQGLSTVPLADSQAAVGLGRRVCGVCDAQVWVSRP